MFHRSLHSYKASCNSFKQTVIWCTLKCCVPEVFRKSPHTEKKDTFLTQELELVVAPSASFKAQQITRLSVWKRLLLRACPRASVHKTALSDSQINLHYHQPVLVGTQRSVSRQVRAAESKGGAREKGTHPGAAFPLEARLALLIGEGLVRQDRLIN